MAILRPKLNRSVRCHIRRQKAKIRRGSPNPEKELRQIAGLYAKFGVSR